MFEKCSGGKNPGGKKSNMIPYRKCLIRRAKQSVSEGLMHA